MSVGLALGSFYEKQQDMVGLTTALLLLLGGVTVAKMPGVELPTLVNSIFSWEPSVALAEICRTAFMEAVPITRVLNNLWIVVAVLLPLHAIVIWKVR